MWDIVHCSFIFCIYMSLIVFILMSIGYGIVSKTYSIWSKKNSHLVMNNDLSFMFLVHISNFNGHHQAGTYKGIQIQQILSKTCMCRVKKSWKYALINRRFLKFWTVFYLPLPKTCVDFCHLHSKVVSLCCLAGVYAMVVLSFWSIEKVFFNCLLMAYLMALL